MDEDTMEHERIREMFGLGRAGEPVPEVDPADVKAVWEVGLDSAKHHPEGGIAIGVEIFKRACKPGADVPAVTYRTQQLSMLKMIRPDVMDPLLQNKPEAVFKATAEIPLEWLGLGIVRGGLPFDPDDFLRRVNEAA
jgi:hypothetical protein